MVRPVDVAMVLALSLLHPDHALAKTGDSVVNKPGTGYYGGKTVTNCQMSDWTPFDDCDATGWKTRNRFVVVQPSKGGSPCPSTMEMVKCAKGEFWMGPWSKWVCHAKTGMKSRTRSVAKAGTAKYKKPATREAAVCDPIPCVINSVDEDTTPWGTCKKDKKGVWTKSKFLDVKSPAMYGGLCPARFDPIRKVTKVCDPVDCELYTKDTDPGTWNACSLDLDGKYYESKVLGIKTQPLYDGKTCPPVTDPSRIAKKLCPAVDCVVRTENQETTNKWDGNCVKDATSDKWYEHKKLGIDTYDKYGGKACPADDAPERFAERLCDPIDCVVRTEGQETVNDWDGDCVKDVTRNKWYEHKKLGIDTYDKYGGTTCPAEGSPERIAERLCDPIDCVVKTDAQEQDNKWDDNCVEDPTRNKWYEHKKLGIQTEAKYGGAECPAEGTAGRLAERVCDPVDCVVRTETQETTYDWDGNCVEDSARGFWYEHKKLGIHTEAANGGAECPAEGTSARLAERKCEPVDCEIKKKEDDLGAWDDNCVIDTTSGKYYEHKVLGVKTAAKWGGQECPVSPDIRVIASRECPAVDCLLRTNEEETTAQWDGVCVEDKADGFWYERKKLGIAREAKNGGDECPDESSPDRFAKKKCDPVDCVVRKEADETTYDWDGDCVEDVARGKWYEHKKLGIATYDKYGGKTCPLEGSTERLAERECPAVDCVINGAEEDQGPYDDYCVEDPTSGLWFEHRVLGIKTQPKYGGKECATDTDPSRIDPRQCTAVNCEVDTSGTFGACTEGQWKSAYKVALLNINVVASNGGKECPSIPERTIASYCTVAEFINGLNKNVPSTKGNTMLKKVNTLLTAKDGSTSFGTLVPIAPGVTPTTLVFTGETCNGPLTRKLTVSLECGTEIKLSPAVQTGPCDWTAKMAMPVLGYCTGKPTIV